MAKKESVGVASGDQTNHQKGLNYYDKISKNVNSNLPKSNKNKREPSPEVNNALRNIQLEKQNTLPVGPSATTKHSERLVETRDLKKMNKKNYTQTMGNLNVAGGGSMPQQPNNENKFEINLLKDEKLSRLSESGISRIKGTFEGSDDGSKKLPTKKSKKNGNFILGDLKLASEV